MSSSYGALIRNERNEIFLSPNFTSFIFQKKITIDRQLFNQGGSNIYKYYTMDTGIRGNILMFHTVETTRYGSNPPSDINDRFSHNQTHFDYSKIGDGIYQLFTPEKAFANDILKSVTFYIFAPKITSNIPKYGLCTYDENGDMVYHSNCKVLEINIHKIAYKTMDSWNGGSSMYQREGTIYHKIGCKVAALGTVCGSYREADWDDNMNWNLFYPAYAAGCGDYLISTFKGESLAGNAWDRWHDGRKQYDNIAYIDCSKYD